MKIEISSGTYHGGTIEFIDVTNKSFTHAYWLQVKDKDGKHLLKDVMINNDDLQRIAKAVDRYRY